jgi:AraC-like DNA-binding protein
MSPGPARCVGESWDNLAYDGPVGGEFEPLKSRVVRIEPAAGPAERDFGIERRHGYPLVSTSGESGFPPVSLDEQRPYDRILGLYLYEEPSLLAAIGRGDRGEAVRIINYVLVHIYSAGQERSDLLKGLLLELVVMMSRAAIEAGSSPSDVLGQNYQCLSELSAIDDDEQLAHWLREIFERAFVAMRRPAAALPSLAIARALSYMRGNLHRDLTRDEVARHAGLSPGHFSRLLREHTGRSFTQLLREGRLDLASELLSTTDEPLVAVAGFCGFCDQAYFTHVFVRTKHLTPRQFREAHRRPASTEDSNSQAVVRPDRRS